MSRPVKRSFSIAGHRTSISLEAPFWAALKDAAAREQMPVAQLFARIDGYDGPTRNIVVPTRLIERGSGELRPPG